MSRFILRQLRLQPARTAALVAILVVAPASTVLLISSAHTQSLRVRGTLTQSYRVPYDILVRPRGSRTTLEQRRGLIEDNYLSGLFGGITFKQLQTIRSIRYVDVAAPVANIGFVQFQTFAHVPLERVVNRSPFQLYRVRYTLSEQDGTTQMPIDGTSYLYYSTLPFRPRTNETSVTQAYRGRVYAPCSGADAFHVKTGAYPNVSLACLSGASPGRGYDFADPPGSNLTFPRGEIGVPESIQLPMMVAAIDPVAEAKLVGLKGAVVSGRYLKPHERDGLRRTSGLTVAEIPMLLSDRTFVDADVKATVERLTIPKGTNVPSVLASASFGSWLSHLPGRTVATSRTSAQDVYTQSFAQLRSCDRTLECSPLWPVSHWTASPPAYDVLGADRLEPLTVVNAPSIWQSPKTGIGPALPPASVPAPDRDVQFRKLQGHLPVQAYFQTKGRPDPGAVYRVVGTFDPSKLAGFSGLARVPMETYYPPRLEPADARTKALLHGRPLLPSLNIGDYAAQPPLLLTTLDAIRPFIDRHTFLTKTTAPISVIRVRVQGSGNLASAARIRLVAQEIHRRTGLDVDVTAGSSPRTVTVDLPAGRFGRPALEVSEGWSEKGVTLAFLSAIDRKTALLSALIPLLAACVLANGAAAVVRSRQREIGILRCLGWSSRALFSSVLGEIAVVGVAGGILAAVLAAIVVAAVTSLQAPTGVLLLLVPATVLLALVAAVPAAVRAASLPPLAAVESRAGSRVRRSPARTLVRFALAGLRGRFARSLPSVAALALGVASLSLLLAIQRSFGGSLLSTVLGAAISLQARTLDYVAVGLILALSASGLADVLLLSLHERRAELSLLRALGWELRPLRQVVAVEAAALGVLGALSGVALALAGGFAVGLPGATLLATTFAVAAGGVALAILSSLVAASRLGRIVTPSALAAE